MTMPATPMLAPSQSKVRLVFLSIESGGITSHAAQPSTAAAMAWTQNNHGHQLFWAKRDAKTAPRSHPFGALYENNVSVVIPISSVYDLQLQTLRKRYAS